MPTCSSHGPAPRPAEGAGYQTCFRSAIAPGRLTPGQHTACPLRAKIPARETPHATIGLLVATLIGVRGSASLKDFHLRPQPREGAMENGRFAVSVSCTVPGGHVQMLGGHGGGRVCCQVVG